MPETQQHIKVLSAPIDLTPVVADNWTQLYMSYVLCHALPAINANSDSWTPATLANSFKSVIHSPFNIEHWDTDIVGHTYDAALIEQDGQVFIVGAAVIYRDIFYCLAHDLQNNEEEGNNWRVSMECYFDKVALSYKGRTYTEKSERWKELSPYMGALYDGKPVVRLLGGAEDDSRVFFSGAALVKVPADTNARILSVKYVDNDGKAAEKTYDASVASRIIRVSPEPVVLSRGSLATASDVSRRIEELRETVAERRAANSISNICPLSYGDCAMAKPSADGLACLNFDPVSATCSNYDPGTEPLDITPIVDVIEQQSSVSPEPAEGSALSGFENDLYKLQVSETDAGVILQVLIKNPDGSWSEHESNTVPHDIAGQRIEEWVTVLADGLDDVGELVGELDEAMAAEAGMFIISDSTDAAVWTQKYVNDLPDAAFAGLLPGGKKDEGGNTAPRAKRKLPHHDASVKKSDENGSVGLAPLRNALARLPMTQCPSSMKKRMKSHLAAHAKVLLKGDSGKSSLTQATDTRNTSDTRGDTAMPMTTEDFKQMLDESVATAIKPIGDKLETFASGLGEVQEELKSRGSQLDGLLTAQRTETRLAQLDPLPITDDVRALANDMSDEMWGKYVASSQPFIQAAKDAAAAAQAETETAQAETETAQAETETQTETPADGGEAQAQAQTETQNETPAEGGEAQAETETQTETPADGGEAQAQAETQTETLAEGGEAQAETETQDEEASAQTEGGEGGEAQASQQQPPAGAQLPVTSGGGGSAQSMFVFRGPGGETAAGGSVGEVSAKGSYEALTQGYQKLWHEQLKSSDE